MPSEDFDFDYCEQFSPDLERQLRALRALLAWPPREEPVAQDQEDHTKEEQNHHDQEQHKDQRTYDARAVQGYRAGEYGGTSPRANG